VADPMPAEAEARRLGQKLLAAFDAPFEIAGRACRIGLTIGYALAPQDGLGAEGLLRRADAAMYEGKRGGKHQLRRLEEATAA
jgi:diguanylate cyclase